MDEDDPYNFDIDFGDRKEKKKKTDKKKKKTIRTSKHSTEYRSSNGNGNKSALDQASYYLKKYEATSHANTRESEEDDSDDSLNPDKDLFLSRKSNSSTDSASGKHFDNDFKYEQDTTVDFDNFEDSKSEYSDQYGSLMKSHNNTALSEISNDIIDYDAIGTLTSGKYQDENDSRNSDGNPDSNAGESTNIADEPAHVADEVDEERYQQLLEQYEREEEERRREALASLHSVNSGNGSDNNLSLQIGENDDTRFDSSENLNALEDYASSSKNSFHVGKELDELTPGENLVVKLHESTHKEVKSGVISSPVSVFSEAYSQDSDTRLSSSSPNLERSNKSESRSSISHQKASAEEVSYQGHEELDKSISSPVSVSVSVISPPYSPVSTHLHSALSSPRPGKLISSIAESQSPRQSIGSFNEDDHDYSLDDFDTDIDNQSPKQKLPLSTSSMKQGYHGKMLNKENSNEKNMPQKQSSTPPKKPMARIRSETANTSTKALSKKDAEIQVDFEGGFERSSHFGKTGSKYFSSYGAGHSQYFHDQFGMQQQIPFLDPRFGPHHTFNPYFYPNYISPNFHMSAFPYASSTYCREFVSNFDKEVKNKNNNCRPDGETPSKSSNSEEGEENPFGYQNAIPNVKTGHGRQAALHATVLAANRNFKQNLQLIRQHLQDCRMTAKSIMSESSCDEEKEKDTFAYTSLEETREYIKAYNPIARMKKKNVEDGS